MASHIDQFREELRLKLANLESGLGRLGSKIEGCSEICEREVRSRLYQLRLRMEQGRAKVAGAKAEIRKWTDEQKNVSSDTIAEWKEKREAGKLQHRADSAGRYAAAAATIAMASLDEAEEAALEAWLERREAESATSEMPIDPAD